MVDKLESIADVEASFDRARAYLRSEGWPDDHGAIGYMAVVALLAGYERRSATPANGEQVERVARAIAVKRGYDKNGDQLTPAGYPWWQQFTPDAEAALATLSIPTEDARSRVKVLEEALNELRKETWFILGVNHPAIQRAMSALGNKETDRHG